MNRRSFIASAGGLLMALAGTGPRAMQPRDADSIEVFLAGDVMTGRGLDQALPHHSDPVLYETWVKDAREYLRLAEAESGGIPVPVSFEYPWGDALAVLAEAAPDVRVVNLETAVTTSDQPWPGKGIHYRMHPGNVPCLIAAGLDVCVLGNNHVLDWGREGLLETVRCLQAAGIRTAGAGPNLASATAAAEVPLGGNRRLKVYSMASVDSGLMPGMVAGADQPGLNALSGLSPSHTAAMLDRIRAEKQPGDIVIASVHWGGNWGYGVPPEQRAFASALVVAGVDVVHGHSSHHAKGVEVIEGRPVLYGCGDLINDYEGIDGRHEDYRGELALMYFVRLDAASGALLALRMRPMRVRRLRLVHAAPAEAHWLCKRMHRECRKLNTSVRPGADGWLSLGWDA